MQVKQLLPKGASWRLCTVCFFLFTYFLHCLYEIQPCHSAIGPNIYFLFKSLTHQSTIKGLGRSRVLKAQPIPLLMIISGPKPMGWPDPCWTQIFSRFSLSKCFAVLDDTLCPSFMVPHNLLQYPEYYSPLYYSNLGTNWNIFMNPLSIAIWLESAILNHHSNYMYCKFWYTDLKFKYSVYYIQFRMFCAVVLCDGRYLLLYEVTSIGLAKSSFTVCSIFHTLFCYELSLRQYWFI